MLFAVAVLAGVLGVAAADQVGFAVRAGCFVVTVAAGAAWLFRDFPGGPNRRRREAELAALDARSRQERSREAAPGRAPAAGASEP